MLTVTDASGSTASVTQSLVVKAPSITKVSVTKGAKTEKLKVALSGPGTLKLGSKKTKVKGPRTVTLKVKLSGKQLSTPNNIVQATVRYKLDFLVAAGKEELKHGSRSSSRASSRPRTGSPLEPRAARLIATTGPNVPYRPVRDPSSLWRAGRSGREACARPSRGPDFPPIR